MEEETKIEEVAVEGVVEETTPEVTEEVTGTPEVEVGEVTAAE